MGIISNPQGVSVWQTIRHAPHPSNLSSGAEVPPTSVLAKRLEAVQAWGAIWLHRERQACWIQSRRMSPEKDRRKRATVRKGRADAFA
jgi:hypothetical protein